MLLLFGRLAAARASREKLGGRLGSNLKVGDCCACINRSANCGAFGGDDDGELCGGADMDLRDLRVAVFLRRILALGGEALTGDEDSAPDWKIFLSSQPLSSAV